MAISAIRMLFPLLDPTTDGGAGGGQGAQGGAQGDQSSQGSQSTGAQQGAAQTTGTQGQQAAADGGQSRTGAGNTGFTYAEDRSRWIPPHRFNEVSGRTRTLETQLAERDRQIAALTGAQSPDPNAARSQQVRDAFLEMFPQLKPFLEMKPEQLQAILDAPQHVGAAAEAEQREWNRHGKAQLSTLYSNVAEVIGAESLTEDQQTDLRDSFKAWFGARVQSEIEQSVRTTGEGVSDTLRRYQEGDPKLLAEFVTRYTKNWVEPSRRQATATNLPRTRPAVNASGRNQPVTSTKRPDKFKDLDELLDHAVGAAKERGVIFGR